MHTYTIRQVYRNLGVHTPGTIAQLHVCAHHSELFSKTLHLEQMASYFPPKFLMSTLSVSIDAQDEFR